MFGGFPTWLRPITHLAWGSRKIGGGCNLGQTPNRPRVGSQSSPRKSFQALPGNELRGQTFALSSFPDRGLPRFLEIFLTASGSRAAQRGAMPAPGL